MEEKSRFRVRVGTYKLFYIVYNARVSRSASFALCLRNKVSAKLARVLYIINQASSQGLRQGKNRRKKHILFIHHHSLGKDHPLLHHHFQWLR